MKLLDRVADPSETVEFAVDGRGFWLGLVLLAGTCYLVIWPPISAKPLRWFAVIFGLALLSSLIRDVRRSPFFAGPLLTLTPTEIAGRGGIAQSPWRLNWDQVERVTWGRYGLFVFRADAAKWQQPYRQGGVGGPLLARAITKRLDASGDQTTPWKR